MGTCLRPTPGQTFSGGNSVVESTQEERAEEAVLMTDGDGVETLVLITKASFTHSLYKT